MLLKNLQETFHLELLPPAVLLEDVEAASQNVPHIATTANVARQRTVCDSDKNRACVVQHNIDIFHGLDGFLDFVNGSFHLFGEVFPRLLNVIDFIDVERARVGPILVPNALVWLQLEHRKQVSHSVSKSVAVAG